MKLKREAFAACIAEVAAKAAVDENAAWDIIQTVANRGEQLRKKNVGGAFVQAASDIATQARAAAAQKKADAFRNALKVEGAMQRVRTEGGIQNAAKTLRSMMHWLPGATNNESVQTLGNTLSRNWVAVLGTKLRQAGLEKVARSNDISLEYQIAEHIWKANEKGGDVTLSKNDPASVIAAAIKPMLDNAKDRLNAVGAHIGTAVDYVTHSNWNERQLRLAAGPGTSPDEAFAAWLRDDGPRIADKTFEHLEPAEGETFEQAKQRFLRSVFDATSSGIHKTGPGGGLTDDGAGYIPPAYEGTHNVARAVSQQRVIYWKDSKSWVDHQQQYGGGNSLYAQAVTALDRAGSNVALMEKFGTNPAGNLNTIIRRIQEEYRTDYVGLDKFNSQIEGLNNVMGNLDGRLKMPVNVQRANLVNSLLAWEAQSKLGGVSLTHLAAAPATVTSELAHHGVNRLAALSNLMGTILTGRGSAEHQAILADAGAYARNYASEIYAEINKNNGIPGYIAWTMSKFMKFTGLEHFLGRIQADGVRGVLMAKLGRSADLEFGALDPHQVAALRRYGINEQEWDLLRTARDPHVEGTQRYMTPSDAMNTDTARVTEILKSRGDISDTTSPEDAAKAVRKFQWDLGDKYGMYLNDSADHATVTPGVKERAATMGESQPGSTGWMLKRAFLQFKMWPIAAMNQILMRDLLNSLSKKEAAYNIVALLGFSAVGGALRMSVNDAVSGRPQRDFEDPKTLLAALAQGGGLGIYGDFLFGETNRMGQDFTATAMGPAAAELNSFYRMYQHFMQAVADPEESDKALKGVWPELAHWASQHVPFANLIYVKGALDYLLWYSLFEAASPGWWERTNKRLEKEQGRTMTGYTPGGGVPYGVPGVYLKTPGGETSGVLAGAQ